MRPPIVETCRAFLAADCDALAAFYGAAGDWEERNHWAGLSLDIEDMPAGLLEAQATYLAQLVALQAERVACVGEA